MNTTIKKYEAKCDAENNPPTTIDKQLNVLVNIQFVDQHDGKHYSLRLTIPLKALREGSLDSLPIGYVTATDSRLWEPLP